MQGRASLARPASPASERRAAVPSDPVELPQALQAYAVAPHMKAYAGQVKDLTANRAIHVMQAA